MGIFLLFSHRIRDFHPDIGEALDELQKTALAFLVQQGVPADQCRVVDTGTSGAMGMVVNRGEKLSIVDVEAHPRSGELWVKFVLGVNYTTVKVRTTESMVLGTSLIRLLPSAVSRVTEADDWRERIRRQASRWYRSASWTFLLALLVFAGMAGSFWGVACDHRNRRIDRGIRACFLRPARCGRGRMPVYHVAVPRKMMRIVGPLAALAAHAAVAAGVAMAMHVDRHVGVPVVIVGLLLFIPGSSESRENK
jgi:hypothetical protein